ncbi:Acyl-CoA N-acyltransferase [Planctomycetales bacterium 10988]|nr:Acyl-CoA N-acyltransferase [Planctomycetales bacterium 10988]
MQASDLVIRTMSREEVQIALDWAAAEGWNPGLHDAASFYEADPEGFFIGLLKDEPVATISAVKYGNEFGFLGLYIVKPEYRGQGFGKQVWKAGLEYLEGCNIGLDGVVEQQENYKKQGFAMAYKNLRYQGIGGGERPEVSGLTSLSAIPFEEIEAYDREMFPAPRPNFLQSWIKQPESIGFAIKKDGQLAGYSLARRCHEGYKVGPLFAGDSEIAEQLFVAIKSELDQETPVILDIPIVNPAAVDLVQRHKMVLVFETARMYTRSAPDISLGKVFGITTFELG